MEKLTRDNFRTVLTASGYLVSKCAACGNKYKVYKTGFNNQLVEIRPSQTQFGTFVIIRNSSAVASGYLYELSNVIDKYFSPAQV